MKFDKSFHLLDKARCLIPSLTQTFSRAPYTFVEGAFPVYAEKAHGCYFTDVDNNKFLDYLCGLGPVILGYSYGAVDKAIKKQLEKGILFSLPSKLELELSEKICNLIPCAEMVKFSKTGSDAATGAIRAARALTKKDKIAYCGTGGVWHDWYASIISRNMGIPKFNQELIIPFEYNDINSLKKIFENNKDEISCVFMEPTLFQKPNSTFLQDVKKLTHENNSILIFDEIVTAFRFSDGGAQKYFGTEPDIAVLGKGIANGMPLSAIVGKSEYMQIFDDVFFSTTYASDTLSLAASLATIDEIQDKPVIKNMWNVGSDLIHRFNKITKEASLDLKLTGYPVRMNMECKTMSDEKSILLRSLFVQEMIKKGIFMHPNIKYISYSHTDKEIDMTIDALIDSLPLLKKAVSGNIASFLEGKPAKPVYHMIKKPE